jgi:O-antigen/teichoic acid export membrane protein
VVDKPKELSFGANAFLHVSSWFVPAITALIAVPITVRGLGADSYGLLALIGALIGYLGIMEIGLSSAIVRYLSFYRALNEGRPMLGIIRFGVTWFGGAGVIGAILLLVGAEWLAESLLNIPPDQVPTAVVAIRITGLGFLTGMLTTVGAAVPQSFLRYDLAAIGTVVFGVAGSAGPAVLVTLGYGLIAIVVYNVATNVVAIGFYVAVGLRLFAPVDLSAGPSWRSIRRRTLKFAGVASLNQIHSVIAHQTSRVVVGAASGVAAAAYYQVPAMLSSRVTTMLSRAAYVIFPTASGLKARNDEESVRTLYLRTSRLFFVVNASVNMAMVAFAYPLLKFWVSPEYAEEGALALVFFSVSAAINGTSMSASQLNMAAARPGVNVAFAFSNSVIALSTVYPLTVRFGVAGAALAGLLGALNVPFFFWYVHKRVIHMSSWRVWKECYQATVLANLPIGIFMYLVVAPLLFDLASALIAFAAASLLGMTAAGLLGAVKREDLRASWAAVTQGLGLRRRGPADAAGGKADHAA